MISGVVYTALQSLVNGRCDQDRFPQEAIGPPGVEAPVLSYPTWPRIRYAIVDAINEATICGTDTVDTDDTTMQVDVGARTSGARDVLRDQVIAVMQNVTPPCTREPFFNYFDHEKKIFMCSLQFKFSPSTGSGSP